VVLWLGGSVGGAVMVIVITLGLGLSATFYRRRMGCDYNGNGSKLYFIKGIKIYICYKESF